VPPDLALGDSEGDDSVTDSHAESGGDSAGDGEAENSDQAFNVPLYEARRGESIAPRSNILDRFDSRYPIGFEAEFVAHYRTLCAGAASVGREAEANALYAIAAYLTEVSNALAETARRLKAIEARVPPRSSIGSTTAGGRSPTRRSRYLECKSSQRRGTKSSVGDRARAGSLTQRCSCPSSMPWPRYALIR
jgi:hypothetical protein